MKNYKSIACWLILFCVLFAFLQTYSEFHFYCVEQNQMFLFSWSYVLDRLPLPGGAVLLASEFLVQFFIYPYAGAALTALLLVGVGVWTQAVLRRMAPTVPMFGLSLLPALGLLFVQFDFNYFLQGTVAYLLLLQLFWFYLWIKGYERRLVAALVLTPLLYWAGGAVAGLFAVAVVCYELFCRTPRGWWTVAVLVEALLLGVVSVYFSVAGEYRFVFLPDAYYHHGLTPQSVIYYAWICLPLLLAVACLLRTRKALTGKPLIAVNLLQVILVLALCWWGVPKYGDAKSARVKAMDYYTRTGQWDQIITMSKGEITNFLNMSYLNMALAHKGKLADDMFAYDQRGPQGLLVQWNKSAPISTLLNEIYFTMGNCATAQEMAFEGFVSAPGEGNPRLLKRLVETNLIYGAYPVAEKYINLLEQTLYYRDWATAHRKFLYHDEEVERDPLLGGKRRSLPMANHLALVDGLDKDLKSIAEANPSNPSAIQYLGAYYLLNRDLGHFKGMIETYYGTEVLPVLPRSFQEAVITLSESEPGYWTRFGISNSVMERFTAYKQQVLANKSNPTALPG
ncbi:MAG: DUF6057 family protein, partial [Tannerellaceae bacterium]